MNNQRWVESQELYSSKWDRKNARSEEVKRGRDGSRGDDAVPTNPFKKINIIPANIRIGEWPTKLIA